MRCGVLLLLIFGATAVCWGQDAPKRNDSTGEIPFEVNRNFGTILIRAQVNKQPATLVVDTGSSHTILSSDILRIRASALEHAGAAAKGSGFVGSAGWGKATIQIGTMMWSDRKVLVMDDFRDLSNTIKQRVDGIIGEDVLREFNFVGLDFKNQRLVLLH